MYTSQYLCFLLPCVIALRGNGIEESFANFVNCSTTAYRHPQYISYISNGINYKTTSYRCAVCLDTFYLTESSCCLTMFSFAAQDERPVHANLSELHKKQETLNSSVGYTRTVAHRHSDKRNAFNASKLEGIGTRSLLHIEFCRAFNANSRKFVILQHHLVIVFHVLRRVFKPPLLVGAKLAW